jgi:uncharacterized protein (DUF1330 family)
MAAYLVVQIEIHDPVPYAEYLKMTPPTIAAYGGRYVARGGKVTVLEGEWTPRRFVIVEFENAERAQAWWDSHEYAAAKALRQSCASTQMLLVEGM